MENLKEQEGEAELEGETMESLMAQQAAVTQKLSGRQVAWVKVIAVTKDQVLVDIGEKREGVVALSEFVSEPSEEGQPSGRAPVAGQRIPVVMLPGSRRDSTASLSYKRAKAELGWESAVKAYAEKARVRGVVTSAVKGGFMVNVAGVSGFLPASLADLRPVRNPARMVHTGVRCYIIELNEAKKQVVLSRKAVLEEEAAKRHAKVLSELRQGEVRIGRVVHAGPNGLVVDIGGLEGLVRPQDISWGPAAAKPQGTERGSKLKVKVLQKPQKEGEPVLLGLKQLQPNPADALRRKFAPKSVVHGKVSEATSAGLKIVLDGGQGAFCAAVDCDKDAQYKAGQPVSAIVTGVNPATFDVVVSINKFEEIRDRKRMAQYLKAPPPLTLGQLLSPEKPD